MGGEVLTVWWLSSVYSAPCLGWSWYLSRQRVNKQRRKNWLISKFSKMLHLFWCQLQTSLLWWQCTPHMPTFHRYKHAIWKHTKYLRIIFKMAMNLGVSADKASFLISMVGVTNTIGRVISGGITDLPFISPLVVSCIATIIGMKIIIIHTLWIY